MPSGSPRAFVLSALLHGAVIAIALLLSYASNRTADEAVKVFELVAGEGNDFMAKEAPALGREGGAIKVAVNQVQPQPTPPQPQPTPPQPSPPQPQPVVQPAPPPTQPQPAPKAAPTKKITPTKEVPVDKKLKQTIADAKRNAKRDLDRQQKAEEKKRLEQERISKEQFDRENKNKAKQVAAATKNSAVKKIDVDGIAGGVAGGSSASRKGAGGKALTNENVDDMAGYYTYFKQELRKLFEPPPGLADSLEVEIEVRNNADGTLSSARVSKTSGVKQFDDSVLDAIRRVKLPARPDKKTVTFSFVFTMRERGEG